MGTLSVTHWIILIIIGFVVMGVLAGIVLLVITFSNRHDQSAGASRQAALEADNARLQAELARLKKERG